MPALTWAGERLAPLWTLLGTAALTVAVLGVGPVPPPGLAALGLACLALACRVPGEGLRLAGPVAAYELVRATRRRRVVLWRALLAVWMLLVVWRLFPDPGGYRETQPIGEVSRFGLRAAQWCLLALWGVVPVTVAAIAPAVVAEDRERRQLDFALVTDLRSRELVFGRLLAALAEAGALALVAVPLLALLPLFGGVEPAALACSLALLCSTSLALAGLGAWASARSRTAGVAAGRTAAIAVGYLAASFVASKYLPWLAVSPAKLLLAANPFALAWEAVAPGYAAGGAEAWALARPTLAVHLALYLTLSGWAAARLRAVASDAGAGRRRSRKREPVPDDTPIVWREWPLIRRACPRWTLVAAVVPLALYWLSARPSFYTVRLIGFAAVSFHVLLLARAVAARFDADARNEMWDLLRLTDWTGSDIVAQKGRAAWRGGRRGFLVAMGLVWTVAAAQGMIAWWAVPALLALTYAAQAGAVAAGVWAGVTLGPRGRAARTVIFVWALFALPPVPLADATRGAALLVQPAGGVLAWTLPPEGVTFFTPSEIQMVMSWHAVGAMLVLPAAWWLRRLAAGRVRPLVVRPSE